VAAPIRDFASYEIRLVKLRLKLLLQCSAMDHGDYSVISSKPSDPQRPSSSLEKARRPSLFRQNRGTVWKCRMVDLRCCRLATSETGMQQSTSYSSVFCFVLTAPVNRHCQLVLHSLRNTEPVQFVTQKNATDPGRTCACRRRSDELQHSADVEACQLCTEVIR